MNYLKYEEKVRQDSDENQKKILSFYLSFFKNCKKVLDLACGKGNFLELLNNKGIGVDSDKAICELVRNKGLKVIEDDLINYLETTKEVFDGIMASHIIEHFDIKNATKIIGLCYKHLNKGGVLVLVTPNAESITARLYFEKDPTHVRFYPHQLLAFMAEEKGFKFRQNGSNPYSQARIWEKIDLKQLESKKLRADELSRIFGTGLNLEVNNEELNNAKKVVNALIKKINILESFILNPMDAYVVMEK